MTGRHISNELVDHILDNLYFDRDTLLDCALVGRAWVCSSQRGIFREIILRLPAYHPSHLAIFVEVYLKTTTHLDTLFAEKPYIASYVRSLELRTPREYSSALPEVVYSATTSLVRRLSSLNSLSFVCVNWRGLPPLLQAALTEICEAPSITRLSAIDFYPFPELAPLLSHMKNLKMLDVTRNDWLGPILLPEFGEEGSHPPRRIQLDELQLRLNNVRSFIHWSQQDSCPLGIHNLKSLEIISGVDVVAFRYFGTDLRELTLRGYPNRALNLAHLTNLRSLSLVDLYETGTETDSPAFWMQALFKPLPNSEGNIFPLQHLTINFTLYLSTDPLNSCHWNRWAAFDTLLGKPEFASLETVELEASFKSRISDFQ
ncbi:hypothetical protein BT96DRAFT_1016183 [Gymnopus androsaceus JB14]|uniref:F-box domain-containing protein n=1 Tax=Gymnopus androsaceus JB14 TaxID=1447944 RepID=A0A6A4I3R2_9AGAR|nr:hypothetical protein BT96DRAFT_1016183 [Gymnopus androsaceus JB14]